MNDISASPAAGSLAGIRLLARVAPELRRRVERRCRWARYAAGARIVERDGESDDLLFVAEGGVRVVMHSAAGKAVSLRDLDAGELFGEIAAIDGGPRSASVEARTGCLIAALAAADFRALVQAEPALAMALLEQQTRTVRALTTRVFEFSAAVMAVTGRRLYGELQNIRAKDVYPDEELKARLLEQTFPASPEDMTLKLSNVTAAFYGVLLKTVGEKFGWGEVDAMSRAVFRQLGLLKTREAIDGGVAVPGDSRALALVFITAVHSASPEYNFHVFDYTPELTVMRVFGISRYDRIAKRLDIEQHLTWPELTPFFEGIAEAMGIDCDVSGELRQLGDAGAYDCLYSFRLR